MSRGRMNGTGIACERCLWRRIFLVAGAILIGSVSSVPVASATLIGETADTVGSTVGSTVETVDATANGAPSPPSAMPPATPPAPVATPAAPQAPVKLQTEAAPTPSSSPSSPGVDVPPVDGIASAARNVVGSVTSAGKETTQQVAAPIRNDDSQVSTPPNGPTADASKAAPRAIGTPSSAPSSIAAAEVAALQRRFARIWPAIPLGGGAGREWVARVIGGLFRQTAVAAAQSLFSTPLVARAAGDSPSVGQPGRTAISPRLSPPAAPVSAGGTRVIYLVVIAALLALLAFTVWREFRSALRPGVRW